MNLLYELVHCLAEKCTTSLGIWQLTNKLCQNVTYRHEFTVSKKKPIILAALIAHHTPTLTSWNGTSYLKVRFSADRYLLLWALAYPVRWNQASLLNRMSEGFISFVWIYDDTSCSIGIYQTLVHLTKHTTLLSTEDWQTSEMRACVCVCVSATDRV
jgi:hypothetical protein